MTTVQKNNLDYHIWNTNKKGIIKDDINTTYCDFISKINFGHTDYTLIYKEWDEFTPFYIAFVNTYIEGLKKITKKDKINILKKNEPLKCLLYSLIKKELFHYDINIGSLGFVCKKTNKVHWEFGNGKTNSDY